MFRHKRHPLTLIPPLMSATWEDVTTPAGCTITLPFTVQRTPSQIRADPSFNLRTYAAISVTKTYYLNTVTGSDAASGLTAALPNKTWNHIMGHADADRIIIQDGSYLIRPESNTLASRDLEVIGEGTVIWSSEHTMGEWTLTAGKTYTFQSNVTDGEYISRVFDEGTLDAFGHPTVYSAQTSTADVEANAGSKYWTGGVLYVHTLDGLTPAGRTDLRFYDTNAFGAAKDKVFYFENINFRGGFSVGNATALGVAKFYIKNCTGHGVAVTGATEIIFQNCTFFKFKEDGFNYDDGNSVVTKAIEIDCHIYNGGAATTDQASTIHNGSSIVRINGRYHHVTGQCVADTGTGQTWMLGCELYNSSTAGIAITQQNPEMWLDTIYTHDNANYDILNGASKTVYTHNCTLTKGVNSIGGTLTPY